MEVQQSPTSHFPRMAGYSPLTSSNRKRVSFFPTSRPSCPVSPAGPFFPLQKQLFRKGRIPLSPRTQPRRFFAPPRGQEKRRPSLGRGGGGDPLPSRCEIRLLAAAPLPAADVFPPLPAGKPSQSLSPPTKKLRVAKVLLKQDYPPVNVIATFLLLRKPPPLLFPAEGLLPAARHENPSHVPSSENALLSPPNRLSAPSARVFFWRDTRSPLLYSFLA